MFNATASTVPLSESEVEIIKRQHDKKEWGYKCNDTPMCNLCDKKLCRERKFGIGAVSYTHLTLPTIYSV